MTTPATPWHSNSLLPLREIIRRAIEDDKVLALGARDISLPFVPAEVTDFSVDSVCTVADIEAARTAIIRAIPALERFSCRSPLPAISSAKTMTNSQPKNFGKNTTPKRDGVAPALHDGRLAP